MIAVQPNRIGRTIHLPKAAELVANELRGQIVRGQLRDGDVLPSEPVLTAQFGVSRPTIREALRVLESERLLSVRRGSRGGAHVHAPKGDVAAWYAGLVLQYRAATVAEMCEARALIEPHCAGLLASRRTAGDLDLLWANIEDGEGSLNVDIDLFMGAHAEFHALVIELAGNETLRLLDEMLRDLLQSIHFSKMAHDRKHGEDGWSAVDSESARMHRRLVERVAARDVEGATQLWKAHLSDANHLLAEPSLLAGVLDSLT